MVHAGGGVASSHSTQKSSNLESEPNSRPILTSLERAAARKISSKFEPNQISFATFSLISNLKIQPHSLLGLCQVSGSCKSSHAHSLDSVVIWLDSLQCKSSHAPSLGSVFIHRFQEVAVAHAHIQLCTRLSISNTQEPEYLGWLLAPEPPSRGAKAVVQLLVSLGRRWPLEVIPRGDPYLKPQPFLLW